MAGDPRVATPVRPFFAGLVAALALGLSSCQTNSPVKPTQPSVIGLVTSSSGYPELVRKNQTYILAVQSRIYADDVVSTDKESKVIIKMQDGSAFNIGPNSHFVLHRYELAEDQVVSRANMTITSGSFQAYLGATNEQSRFQIRTPLAVINTSGGEFWGGFSFTDNTLDVALFAGGQVTVGNDHGTVELKPDAWGTSVIGDSAPQPAKAWSNQKLERALAETKL